MHRISVAVFVTLAVSSLAMAAPRTGRYDILVDAHGYNNGGSVLLPLRAIGDWLGAQVRFGNGLITIRDGSRTVSLRAGAKTATVNGAAVKLARPARVYGGVTCVPVRFVGEAFGCQVQYLSTSDQTEYLNYINHVVLTRGDSRAVVIVHDVSPDLVTGVIAGEAATRRDESLGHDYLVRVARVKDGWAEAWVPWWWDDELGFSFKAHKAFYQRSGGRWVQRFATTRAAHPAEDFTNAGVPLSAVRALGMGGMIEEPY